MSIMDEAVGIVMPLASQRGGAEALLQHLLRCGHGKVPYFCAFLEDGPLVEHARQLGYDTVVFPTTHLRELGNYVATVRALRKWIKQKQLSVVVSWMHKAHLYLGIAALGLPVRVLWYQHGVPHGHILDRLTTFIPAAGVLCCSETSNKAQKAMWPKRRTHVCYPGVPMPVGEPISQHDARVRLGLPLETPVIGMVSRLEHWKGVHIFLQAAERILARHPDATLFVVGGVHSLAPKYAEEIEALAKALALPEQILIVGQRPSFEVPLWQASADLIIHPTVGTEPFGMAVVEAMSHGKTVVASNLGGPSEIIVNGESGLLIEPRDPELLAEAIEELLQDGSRLHVLAAQARTRAATFSDQAFSQRFNAIVSEFTS